MGDYGWLLGVLYCVFVLVSVVVVSLLTNKKEDKPYE